MTVDQSSTSFALDRGEVSFRFGWLSVEKISGTRSGEAEEGAEAASGHLMPPPASPIWPRVYPGL
jgi:hypothetical protein